MIKIIIFSFATNFFYFCLGSIFFFKNKNIDNLVFYKTIIGIIIASFIALLLNFFIPLNRTVNTSIFFFVILIFFLKNKLNIKKEEIFFLIISSLICFFLIILSNVNRPDAGLYHLPYISILNEYKIIFGLNNLHARFGHVSIIQYLCALNNNFFFKDNGIIVPLASVVSFYYLYFTNEVLKIYKKKIKIDVASIFSLATLIYIAFKIIGYDNFGNDAIAHLSVFYLITQVLKNENKNINIKFLILVSVFVFLNKSTMIFIFIIPTLIIIDKYKFDYKKIFSLTKSFPTIFLALWLIKNIIVSGCAIYPVTFTCIPSLPWLNINSVNIFSIQSEAWAKAWPENQNPNLTMELFINNFNWVHAWTQINLIYILKIIIPYCVVLILLLLFLKISIKNFYDKFNLIKITKFYWLTFFVSFLGTLYFFFKFPLYRYGYSYLVSLIILIFIFFLNDKILKTRTVYACKFIFLASLIIFFGKQSLRIINNYQLNYFNKPWPRIYSFNDNSKINSEKRIIDNNFLYYYSKNGECMFSSPPCTNYEVDKNIIAKDILSYTLLVYK
jgi:hypothetical protein